MLEGGWLERSPNFLGISRHHIGTVSDFLPLTGVSRARRARNAERVSKMSPGTSGPGTRKVSKKSREQSGKSPESLRKVSKQSFRTVPETFWRLFGFRGRRPRERFYCKGWAGSQGRGVFIRYFSWKFRVRPFWVSLAGGGFLKSGSTLYPVRGGGDPNPPPPNAGKTYELI